MYSKVFLDTTYVMTISIWFLAFLQSVYEANLPQVTCWHYKTLYMVTNQFLHYNPMSHTNLTNPQCTYCLQYHMHDPLKAVCAGFGWVYNTESACMGYVVWVSFVRLILQGTACFKDVHWIGNTYKLFKITMSWPKLWPPFPLGPKGHT